MSRHIKNIVITGVNPFSDKTWMTTSYLTGKTAGGPLFVQKLTVVEPAAQNPANNNAPASTKRLTSPE